MNNARECNFANFEDIPREELAKKYNVTVQQIKGMIRVPRRSSKIYLSPLAEGYDDKDNPPWVLRPSRKSETGSSTL